MVVDYVVILAGGNSRRMGRDKLDLTIDGRTLLESVVIRFSEVFEEVFISVADETKYPHIKARRIVDIVPGAGPLSGMHAALTALTGDGFFLVAADLPYACPIAAKRVIELCGDSDASIVRLPDGRLEPLFGYYRKTLLARCEAALKSGDFRLTEVLSGAKVRYVSQSDLGELWDEKMIFNINYPEDYEKLQK